MKKSNKRAQIAAQPRPWSPPSAPCWSGAAAAWSARRRRRPRGSLQPRAPRPAATHAVRYSAPVGPANPGGIYRTLSADLKTIYSSYPGALNASPWATTKSRRSPRGRSATSPSRSPTRTTRTC